MTFPNEFGVTPGPKRTVNTMFTTTAVRWAILNNGVKHLSLLLQPKYSGRQCFTTVKEKTRAELSTFPLTLWLALGCGVPVQAQTLVFGRPNRWVFS